jgi:ComF family protein
MTGRLTSEILLGLKNLFLPAFCQRCGIRILTEGNLYFCDACWATIEFVEDPKCPRCGRPHAHRVGFEPIDNFVCSECAGQKWWVENTYAAGMHAGVLRDAIHLLKYQKKRLIVEPLARLLLENAFVDIDIASYDAIVPVPLHRNRLKERGYNQSELIAEHLCRLLCDRSFTLELLPALMRVKDTPSFSMLGAQERRSQIKKAFQLLPDTNVKKKRLLLIDEVVTTGATSNECARVLRRAGAEAVDVIAVAVARRL